VEAAAAAGGAAKAAADAPGARAALAPKLPKEPGGGVGSQGSNAAVQAERSTPIKFLRSLKYTNAHILKCHYHINYITGFHLNGKRYTLIA
jgi:hypothetical protein